MNLGASSIRKKWLDPSKITVSPWGSCSCIQRVAVSEQMASWPPARIWVGHVISPSRSSVSCSRQARWDHHGLQCSFCTPGTVLVARDLLERNPDPTEGEIREAIAGNICRCTGYVFIVDAIAAAAQAMGAPTAR